MDTNSVASVQQRKPTKRRQNKNKPIKVVYISNPMRVETSASKFRALVQELTGQYAEFPPDLTSAKFQPDLDHNNSDDGSDSAGGSGTLGGCGGHLTESENSVSTKIGHDHNHRTVGIHQVGQEHVERFEPLDDVFTPQMIESFSAFLPASVFYESAQLDSVL
ncbi:hypothetical protein L6164_009309 [Bauhinia variegata]|uniref:Uncharacterized protein n=1 Tax=Bauhinia variegata TaxID=167791 RepID=A0ACB9PKM0_BAUVA|nr:hypothetical protein L6164_009309 [Bauhinia variegata]